MKFTLLIAPLAIITVGTLAPRLLSTTTSGLGVLGNDAEKVVIKELAQRLEANPNARTVQVAWLEDNGRYIFRCDARYEPGKQRLVSRTEQNAIEFYPVTPESLHRIATRRNNCSFAIAKNLSKP